MLTGGLQIFGCTLCLRSHSLLFYGRVLLQAGSLDGSGCREIKVLPIPWFDGLAENWLWLRIKGFGREGL